MWIGSVCSKKEGSKVIHTRVDFARIMPDRMSSYLISISSVKSNEGARGG